MKKRTKPKSPVGKPVRIRFGISETKAKAPSMLFYRYEIHLDDDGEPVLTLVEAYA